MLHEDKYIISNIALWLGKDPEEVKKHLDAKQLESLRGVLNRKDISFLEACIRKTIQPFLQVLPENSRYSITDILKRMRDFVRYELVEIHDCVFIKTFLELKDRLKAPGIDWQHKEGVVTLTHDIDSGECYNFIRNTVELEKRYKIRSSFNLLTNWGYQVDPSLLTNLVDDGFEIGLHGYTHDIGLGYRSKKKIKEDLSNALKELRVPIKGFRAPVFSISENLLEVLNEIGLKYDSSFKTTSCYGQGVETCYPYKYPGLDIWEVPLTIQDDRLFRDQHLSCEEGLGIVKELTKRVIGVRGVAVINTHPRLIKRKLRFYEDLLAWLGEQNNIWIAPLGEIIEYLEKVN